MVAALPAHMGGMGVAEAGRGWTRLKVPLVSMVLLRGWRGGSWGWAGGGWGWLLAGPGQFFYLSLDVTF